MKSIWKQIHDNAVALISLFIAVSSLAYNTWRNETTEEQRNVRHASFRVLENLGELQQVVDMRHYYLPFEESRGNEGELRVSGFGNVAMISDLMMLMPAPAPGAGMELQSTWQAHFAQLDQLAPGGTHSDEARLAELEITKAIRASREAVLEVLKELE